MEKYEHTVEMLETTLLKMPEVEELRGVIENNIYHNNESVYDHTLFVWNNVKEILREASGLVNRQLEEKLGNHTRRELLGAAVLLHDVAKKETIVTDERGSTRCPGHEEKGAEKAISLLAHHNLSEPEIAHVIQLIRNHAVTDAIFTPDNRIAQKEHEMIRKKFVDIYLDLMLLAFADAMSEYTKVSRPEEYQLKIDFYRGILEEL